MDDRWHETDPCGWRQEGRDLMRGVAGGAIVGMPLLYTMEMWWHGMTLSEWHLLGLLGAILGVNFVFSLFVGLREHYTPGGALSDAITSLGIAILFSGAVLWLIGELTLDRAPGEMIGLVLVEAAGVSVGVSFANAYRGKSRTGDEDQNGQPDGREKGGQQTQPGQQQDPEQLQLRADLNDLGATLAGAVVFALNIASTEEVLLIAARLAPWQQLAMLGATLLLCYIILFASGFEEHQVHVESVFQHPLAETIMACALSLGASYLLLQLLGQRELLSHPSTMVAGVITLGLPAAVGGAAGRLIV